VATASGGDPRRRGSRKRRRDHDDSTITFHHSRRPELLAHYTGDMTAHITPRSSTTARKRPAWMVGIGDDTQLTHSVRRTIARHDPHQQPPSHHDDAPHATRMAVHHGIRRGIHHDDSYPRHTIPLHRPRTTSRTHDADDGEHPRERRTRTRRRRRRHRPHARCRRRRGAKSTQGLTVQFAPISRTRVYKIDDPPCKVQHTSTMRMPTHFHRRHSILRRRRKHERDDDYKDTSEMMMTTITDDDILGRDGTKQMQKHMQTQERTRHASTDPHIDVPPTIHMNILHRFDPTVVNALTRAPTLKAASLCTPRRPSYISIPDGSALHEGIRRLLAPMRADRARETASLFLRPKPGQRGWRLIVDARNANARDPGWDRIGPPPPRINDIARMLSREAWASTADLKSWFYQLPISKSIQRLFYIPGTHSSFTRLPMGWTRASDVASRATAALVDHDPRHTHDRHVQTSTIICTDNILVGGRAAGQVAERIQHIRRRCSQARATFSIDFHPPRRQILYYGIQWNLQEQRRRLPLLSALRMRNTLRTFSQSRGRQTKEVWMRVAGMAGWICSVCGVDPTRRLAITCGTRIAQHSDQGVTPGCRAREEARRLGDAALRDVAISAPSDRTCFPTTVGSIAGGRTWFVSDAAVPGAGAVVRCRDGENKELVHWIRVPSKMPVIAAELAQIAAAAKFAKRGHVQDPVFATDSLAAWHMIIRGTARNHRHHDQLRLIREAAPRATIVWMPTKENIADVPSRSKSAEEAEAYVRTAELGVPKHSSLCRAATIVRSGTASTRVF